MAEFSKLVITAKGQALIAKIIAGSGNVEFSKISTSSTQYTLQQLEALTSLTNVKQTTLVSKITRTNNVAIKVEGAFTNTELAAGYYMRTIGLYARDPDEGEILYAVTIETSGNCYMPPYNGITVSGAYVQLVTTVGNADNVSLNVDAAAVATIGDINALEAEIADLRAFIGYTDDDIYGTEVDFVNKKFTRLAGSVNKTPGAAFDSIHAFGGRRRCNLTDGGVVVAYQGDAAFTTTGALTQAVTKDGVTYAIGTAVQVMVEQPKFYYKVVPLLTEIITEGENKGQHIRKARYYVSDTMKAGFKVHPAFVENGKENDFIYRSAFEGTIYDVSASAYLMNDEQVADFTVSTGDKLCSIGAAKPASGLSQNLTRANTRKLAQNRGSGWEQDYLISASATQLLMLIEYNTFNMQTAIAQGAVNKADDGATNMAENTGATITLGNASGYVVNSNGIQIVSYRGEENFYGNIWKWLDGVNGFNPAGHAAGKYSNLFVADHGFADDTASSPYEDTGIHPCYGGNYISAFGYSEKYDFLFIPTECNGNTALPVGDYFWNTGTANAYHVATLGAGWDNGLRAGAFFLVLGIVSSYRTRDVGGRLVYVPSKAAA